MSTEKIKDELKVTKAQAKLIGATFKGEIIKKRCSLRISNRQLIFNSFNYELPSIKDFNTDFKWVLTKKIKSGDLVKLITKYPAEIYVVDKIEKKGSVKLWYIYRNRPQQAWVHNSLLYKLKEE